MFRDVSTLQLVFSVLFGIVGCVGTFIGVRSKANKLVYISIASLGIAIFILVPGILSALFILICVVGACLLYIGQQKGNFVKAVAGGVLLLAGAICLMFIGGSQTLDQVMYKNNISNEMAQYAKLGKFAKEKYSGKKIMAIVPEEMPAAYKNYLSAFEKEFGDTVDTVPMKPSYTEDATPENSTVAGVLRSKEIAAADVVLLLIGLPRDQAKMVEVLQFISRKKTQKILLIPQGRGGKTTLLAPYIKKGQIGAFVTIKIPSSIRAAVSENVEDAFNNRYVLVTAENIDEMMENRVYRNQFHEENAGSEGN